MIDPLDGAVWRKSSRSGNDTAQCVELAIGSAAVGIRDSKDPSGPVLVFTPAAVRGFTDAVKAGEFDPAARS